MKTNQTQRKPATSPPTTFEGGKADKHISYYDQLVRSVACSLLWENNFYESGSDSAYRVGELISKCEPKDVANLAVYARNELKLRHAPLFLVKELVTGDSDLDTVTIRETLPKIIKRPDELNEFLALYWKDTYPTKNNKGQEKYAPLAACVKRGLAAAFPNFGAYALAKWDKKGRKVSLADVLKLVHAKPKDEQQNKLWKALLGGWCKNCWCPRTSHKGREFRGGLVCKHYEEATLPTPDTWEVALSTGKDKKATWERLILEGKLGSMALLMNLRNMEKAEVDETIIVNALRKDAANTKALPYRYIAASRHVISSYLYRGISEAMLLALGETRLNGKTIIVVDVSGSMDHPLSGGSTMQRIDAATAMAILACEVFPDHKLYTFSDRTVKVSTRGTDKRGLGLYLEKMIVGSQRHACTKLKRSLSEIKRDNPEVHRIIVITDEQSDDGILAPWGNVAWLNNLGTYEPGLSTDGGWERVSGFSERLFDYISYVETGKILGLEE